MKSLNRIHLPASRFSGKKLDLRAVGPGNSIRSALLPGGESVSVPFHFRSVPSDYRFRLRINCRMLHDWLKKGELPLVQDGAFYNLMIGIADGLDRKVRRSGKHSLCLSCRHEADGQSAKQSIRFPNPKSGSFRIAAWSKCQGITGRKDENYALRVTVQYADNTLGNSSLSFASGTHGWHKVEKVLRTSKPVIGFELEAILAKTHTGRAWFDDLFLTIPGEKANKIRNPGFETSEEWMGFNIFRGNRKKIRIELNESVVAKRDLVLPGVEWPSEYFEVDPGQLRKGKNTLRITNLSAALELPLLVGWADLFSQKAPTELEILSHPHYARCGEQFWVKLHSSTPASNVRVTTNKVNLVAVEREYHKKDRVAKFRFRTKAPCGNASISFRTKGIESQCRIRQIAEARFDGLKVGKELAYARHEKERMLQLLERIQEDGLGNYVGFFNGDTFYNPDAHIPESAWKAWIDFCAKNEIFFNNVNDARDIPSGVLKNADEFCLGWHRHELAGIAYGSEGNFVPAPKGPDMQAAKRAFLRHIGRHFAGKRKTRATNPSLLHRYFLEAGIDLVGNELMYANTDIEMSALRGACRAYGKAECASHIAHHWYSLPHEDPRKYRRYKLALFISYLYGATNIYCENGLLQTSLSYRHDYEDPAPTACRKIQKDFYDFVKTRCRKGQAHVRMALVQGNLDGWQNTSSQVWGMSGKDWTQTAPESGWKVLRKLFPGSVPGSIPWHVFAKKQKGWFSAPQYGHVDLIPSETPQKVLGNYGALIFAGWNTATPAQYRKLTDYVRNGGRILMGIPHLSCQTVRHAPLQLLNKGDFSKLFGLKVLGPKPLFGPLLGKEDAPLRMSFWTKHTEAQDYPFPNAMQESYRFPGNPAQLTGARIKTSSAKVLLRIGRNGPPLLTANRVGKGWAYLIPLWEYPAQGAFREVYEDLVEAIAQFERGEVFVTGTSKINCVVFNESGKWGRAFCHDKGLRKVYLLNIDWWSNPSEVECFTFHLKDASYPMAVPASELKVLAMHGDVALSASDKMTQINRIKRTGKRTTVALQGAGKQRLEVYSRHGLPRRARLDSQDISAGIRLENQVVLVDATLSGKHELLLEF